MTAVGTPDVPLGKRVDRARVSIHAGSGYPAIKVTFPPRALQRVRRIDPKRKLRFRLLVTFADGSSQRVRLRVKPSSR